MLSDPSFWVLQTLNALQLAMLLFLISVGLTVVFGLMNFVNLAHGGFYALGAYAAASAAQATGGFWATLLLAPLAVALFGALIFRFLIAPFRAEGPMAQVLITFGLLFMLVDGVRLVWGAQEVGLAEAPLPGQTQAFGAPYPLYRLVLIGLGLAVFAGLYALLERTRLGASVRACVDDPEMARCLGVDVERTFFGAFLLGCALAGLGGAAALPVLSAEPTMAVEILIPSLAVVVIGGLGSLKGALAGALAIGAAQSFGPSLAQGAADAGLISTEAAAVIAAVMVYALLALVLALKPEGLFPVRRSA